jgi:hypothetical protein
MGHTSGLSRHTAARSLPRSPRMVRGGDDKRSSRSFRQRVGMQVKLELQQTCAEDTKKRMRRKGSNPAIARSSNGSQPSGRNTSDLARRYSDNTRARSRSQRVQNQETAGQNGQEEQQMASDEQKLMVDDPARNAK